MGKKRVHEVAKQLGMGSKELIATLVDLGVDVKSHMSTLDHEAIEKLHRHLGQGNNQSNGAKPAEQAGKAKPQATEPQTGKKTEVQAGKGRTAKAVRLSQYGPGLVDKVPQRPPDRRFIERPMHIPVPIPKTSAEKREDTARSAKGTSPEVPQRTQVPAETPTPVEQPSSTPEVQDAKPAAPPRPQPPRQPATAVPYNQRVPQRPAGRPVQTTPPRPAYRDGQARPGYPGNGGATPHTGRPGQGPRTGGYQRPDNNVRVAPVKQPQQGRPPHYGDRSPHYGGRPTGAAQQHSRTQHAGRPAPGGRPATSRPQGRPGGPILSKSIPKPPAHLEATRPDKGAGLQRFADKKAKGKGAQDRRHWDKRDRYEERQVQHRRKPKSEKRIIPPAERKPIVISGPLTVKELAEKTGIKAAEIIKKLLFLGTMATINQEIDEDTAVLIAEDMGFTVELKPQVDLEAQLELETEEDVDPVNQVVRPPVVTVMGHVDHGKTSLLDAVRHTKVTASEAGGITQHIGAYQVTHNGKKISFLDTPGHEAFTAMRARGARVTDVAILVVAADDGVKPQTIEAINHAKAAEVPIVVAINKIDKPDANPERVKQQLIEHGLVAEEWGGDTIMVPVSALTGEGLDDLLEMILLVAEVNELKANPKRKARGTIIESRLDKGRGPVATVLVQNGTLNTGDVLVAGGVFARVRAMVDHKGRRVKKAGPSTPVEVLGFSDVPAAGEPFYVIDDEKVARQIAGKRQERKRIEDMKTGGRLSLEDVFKRIQEGDVKELPLIIKGDVQGSVEALSQALEKLSTEEVKVHLVHQGVGAITESDIMLASTANAIIIGFNVRPDVNARKAAERENVDVRLYQVIYDATSDVKAALSGLLDPEYREVLLGHAEVRKVFKASKVGTIAGCYVTDGKISRDAGVRVLRDGRIVFTGKVDSLKRFKDDVREVAQGYECGVTLEKFNDIEEGDELEFFTMEEVKRQL